MKLKELFKDPAKWTQHCLARDLYGNPCHIYNKNKAQSFCLLGGIKICYVLSPFIQELLVQRIRNELNCSVSAWNDDPTRTHAEVLELCEKLDI